MVPNNPPQQYIEVPFGVRVTIPVSGSGYMLFDNEWRHLREKIEKIEQPKQLYKNLATILFTLGGSSIGALLTISDGKTILGFTGDVFCWFLLFSTAIVGSVCLIFDNQQKKIIIGTKADALAEMKRIDERLSSTPFPEAHRPDAPPSR